MKKIAIACTALVLVIGLGSCKPKKSAYRMAYEQAKQREIASQPEPSNTIEYEEPETKPAEVAPVNKIVVRKEKVSALDGDSLKLFSVVIGSFQNPTNARALKERMVAQGYKAVLAMNELGMVRVIIASFETKEEAAASRDAVKDRFAPNFKDAWILETMLQDTPI